MLLLFTIIIGAVSIVHTARKNVQAEIASTALLALHMLDAEVLLYSSGFGRFSKAGVKDHSVFRLDELRDVRHLKIDFYDGLGQLRDSNHSMLNDDESFQPSWFVELMDLVTHELPPTKRKIFSSGHIIGELVVTPDPSNEIMEVWEEAKSMLAMLSIFFVVANILVYFAVSRALRPIDNILSALTELESGNLTSRLPKFTLPELSSISDKFNVMAEALQNTIASNHRLTQQIIQIQEEERKNLARELHDEIGQHLTAIHVDAAAILKSRDIEAASKSASAIDTVAKQMMDIVRTILQRLRPSYLDELGLKPALTELTSAWAERQAGTVIDFHIDGDFSQVDEVVLLTIYRVIQECLTNVSRHAQATKIIISVIKEEEVIHLSVIDDGKGFCMSTKSKGFGLAGMNERVDGLGGKFDIDTEISKGVRIEVVLPCSVKDIDK